MSLLLSTGIRGFISSAAKKSGGYVSTFVSGLSGWIINHNGDAEFKSIYARDKIVTNEYVYNRIRVTEDEEVVTSNGKILSATDNEDGTYTVYLDLREGDINPFAEGDLLQGYYHSTENSGVIYAVQKLTVIEDPNTDDQSMLVTCEDGSLPYKYMIIVRIGNTINSDRQSFIKISSRTNCQYFHDGINSFAALDNPDNVKCVLGKADMGLIPSWAQAAINGVRKWFGLIADGVILRGIFILKSSGTTVEDELDGVANKFVDVETNFEIREGQISSKVLLAETYAENAENSATSASGSALIATTKASEAKQTADGFNQTVTEKLTEVNNAALRAEDAASDASDILVSVTEKESSVTQTADGFVQTVTAVTKQAVDDAVDGADQAITDKVSTSVEQSATHWKAEILNGEDTVMAAINADASGVKIQGDKINLKGGVVVNGSFASPFHIYTDTFIGSDGSAHDYDNVVPTSYTSASEMTLSWDLSQSGRRRVLVNYKWGNNTSYGTVKIVAPEGKFFFENGFSYSDLYFSREVVELMGYGDETTFLGWIVLNRRNVRTTRAYGELTPILAQGIVNCYGENSLNMTFKTMRNSILNVERTGKGLYKVSIPSGWNLDNEYMVMATGKGYCMNPDLTRSDKPALASVIEQGTPYPGNPYFTVAITDGTALKDGSFFFTMYSTADWGLYPNN